MSLKKKQWNKLIKGVESSGDSWIAVGRGTIQKISKKDIYLKRKNIEEIILELDLEIEKHFLLLHGYKVKREAIVWFELIRQPTGETSGIGVESFSFIENTDLMDSHIEKLADMFIALYKATPGFTCEECIKWKDGNDA